jgi:hypothetical protein
MNVCVARQMSGVIDMEDVMEIRGRCNGDDDDDDDTKVGRIQNTTV